MPNKELKVEKMFRKFGEYSEVELELWIRDSLRTAFDDGEPREVRVVALENYLALQYFLYKFRLSAATDVMEEKSLAQLKWHFARIFVDRTGMDERLHDYCIEAAVAARETDDEEKLTNWNRVADIILDVLRLE